MFDSFALILGPNLEKPTFACLPCQGDNINGFEPKDRKWDPERLLLGYWHSAATLNFLRSYASSGDHLPLQTVKVEDLKASENYGSYAEDAQAISGKSLTSESLDTWQSQALSSVACGFLVLFPRTNLKTAFKLQ